MKNKDKLTLSAQLCFPMYACSREIIKAYYPLLNKLDLTYTQYIVLMALWEQKRMSVKNLSNNLYLDSGTLTPLLKKMENNGLVNRSRCPDDERCVIVDITDKGMSLKEKMTNIPEEMGEKLHLTDKEFKTLYDLLYKVLGNLN